MDWQRFIAEELEKRGWTLTSAHHAFAESVRQELFSHGLEPETATTEAIRRATVRCYARHLFDTCGEDGTPQQRRAFQELWAYLYPRAMFRLHAKSQAEDATQQTLVKIFQKRTTCHEPGSFLRWCEQILVRLIMDEHREQYEERITEQGIDYVAREIGFQDTEDGVTEDSRPRQDAVADPAQDTPQPAMTEPMRDALIVALRDCLENERQVTVIGELFINDKTFLEVATQLQTTPLNVQVMRTRALKKLRDCPDMQQLVEDWKA